jgi:beta-N-acetylhexosaminidase
MQIPAGMLRPTIGAVQTSHARIRGFRDRLERTDPISVDASALATLLNLPAVSAWREAGGLMVSGSLGALPLRRYYDQTGTTFPAEQIALDAFLAGNDLLILNDFSLTGAASAEQQTILATIRTFQQRYREDLDFQDRVDRAVKRILRLKFRLFPGFQAADATAVPDALDARLGQGLPAVERVAQDSLARLYPSDAQVEAAPLSVPSPEESFLIFTDDRLVVDCTRCPERATLFTTAISQTLTRVAGVPAEQITSLGFADLKAFLAGAPSAQNLNLPELFAQARWIILAEQNLQSDVQQSDAARLLLRERRDLIAGKRVTLFAFGPPYGLSTEDLAPITAGYYAMYSIGQPFVDVAVAALAGQIQPVSSPPVSVAAIDYDLATQIEPDPDQLLRIFVGEAEAGPGTPTPGPPSYRVGDDIRIRTDLILDRNGHPVPDGTPVRFTVVYRDAGDVSQRIDGLTVDGAAAIVFAIENNGRMEIGAVSEPVLSSVRLQLTIAEEGVTIVQTVVPRPPATPTRLPTATATLAPTATPTPTPIALVDSLLGAEPRRANLIDLALSLLGVTLVGAWGYRVESRRKVEDAVDRAVRLVLWGSLSGLAVYTGYAVGLPGADALRAAFGGWTALIVTLVGAVAPWVLDRAWQRSGND